MNGIRLTNIKADPAADAQPLVLNEGSSLIPRSVVRVRFTIQFDHFNAVMGAGISAHSTTDTDIGIDCDGEVTPKAPTRLPLSPLLIKSQINRKHHIKLFNFRQLSSTSWTLQFSLFYLCGGDDLRNTDLSPRSGWENKIL